MPSTDTEAKVSDGATELTKKIKRVADYCRCSFSEALDMPCDLFQLCYKNSVVDELMKTDKGREYLETCKRLATTDIDAAGFIELRDELQSN